MQIAASAEWLVLALALVVPGLAIWALIDLVRRPSAEWTEAGQSQLVWALIVVVVGLVGPVLYLTVGRRSLALGQGFRR